LVRWKRVICLRDVSQFIYTQTPIHEAPSAAAMIRLGVRNFFFLENSRKKRSDWRRVSTLTLVSTQTL